MDKLISVIIPCYNVENYIDRCLNSVLQQTIDFSNLFLICVNDASTDHTYEKLQKWESLYPENVLLINCEQNGRQGTARNVAMSYIQTKYVAFLDSDDWIEPSMYEKMYQNALQTDCDIVFCNSFRDTTYPSKFNCDSLAKSWSLTITTEAERKNFIVSNTIKFNCWDKLIRTDLLSTHHILFPEKLAYEDIFWGSLLYLYAKKICIMEDKLYHYFVNENSTVLALDKPYHKDIFKINDMKWNYYINSGFLDLYRNELEFDYLITGYLTPLKILALRFTTDTYSDYLMLRSTVMDRVPNILQSPYLNMLSEFQQLQLQFLPNVLTKEKWMEFCSILKNFS